MRQFVKSQALVSVLLFLLGLAAILFAIAANTYRLGGSIDAGPRTATLVLAGIALLSLGLLWVSPFGRRLIAEIASQRPREANSILIAVWFGLVTGLAEVVIRLAPRLLLGRFVGSGEDLIWMVPFADLLFFGVIGVVLFVLSRRWPVLGALRTVVFVCSFLSAYIAIAVYGRLQAYAALLLSAGVATQAARVGAAHQEAFSRLVRYSLGWGVLLESLRRPRAAESREVFQPERRHFLVSSAAGMAGLAAAVYAWRRVPELQVLASLPPAAPNATNVLLVVLDTVRTASLSAYGYSRKTAPEIEKFAARSVKFERAFAAAPWTLPSHASMFTGRFPHELSASLNTPLDSAYPTLAEVMSAQGYITAGFVANNLYCSREHGLNRGFAHYEDFPVSAGEFARNSIPFETIANNRAIRQLVGNEDLLGRKHVEEVNENFLRWLAQKGERPFFAFLNYFDAHNPYYPPVEFALRFGETPTNQRINPADLDKLSPQDIRQLNDAYDGCVAYLDNQVGRLIRELEQQGMLEKTLVIVLGDHGEQFGEHGLMQHANSLYMPLLHVPLLVSLPSRIPSGISVREPVSLRDLAATVLDVTRLDNRTKLPGDSLARYWSTESNAGRPAPELLLSEVEKAGDLFPASYPASKGQMKSLILDDMHYIRNYGDGREELYNYVDDPAEVHDLSSSREGLQSLEWFRASLDQLTANGRMSG